MHQTKTVPTFFLELSELLRYRQENKVVVGDFNLVLDVELDRLNTYCNNNRAMREVENMMDEFLFKRRLEDSKSR